MSRRSSTWNLAGDRDVADTADAEPRPHAGWLRTMFVSAALFFAIFAMLALRMRDGADPALTANAKSVKAKPAAAPAASPPAGDGTDTYNTYGGQEDSYGYNPYGSDSASQGYQSQGYQGYAPPPTTRMS
jgi:hypothetical protein